MFFYDAHLHLAQCESFPEDVKCCSCAHSKEEFFEQEHRATEAGGRVLCSFGLHPQNPELENAGFLEKLLSEKRICAVGETGFDMYTAEFKANLETQKKAFEICLGIALRYDVPLIIHDRKAIDLVFKYSTRLAQIKSVIFHSFAFTPNEAAAVLRRGINAYFSFGKQLLNGNKKSIRCVSEIERAHILLETDAPFQTLKGEIKTLPGQIRDVYKKACEITDLSPEVLCERIQENFKNAFC